jgi:hypothetical protein
MNSLAEGLLVLLPTPEGVNVSDYLAVFRVHLGRLDSWAVLLEQYTSQQAALKEQRPAL